MRLRPNPILLGLATWIVLGSIAALLVWVVNGGDRSLGSRLRAHGVTTLGAVTGTDAANHNTVFYRYVVNGRTYQSGYFGDGPEGGANQLAVGERVHIVYDSEAPAESCYCNVSLLSKSSDWWRALIAGLFVTSVISVIIALTIYRRLA